VQRILRHPDPRIITEVYGHLAPEHLRAEVDRLQFGARPWWRISPPHGPPVVHGTPGPRAPLRALEGGAGRLLTVREAAERLAVSTFTVYGLCDRGEFPLVRVSNAHPDRPRRPGRVHGGAALGGGADPSGRLEQA